MRDTSEFKDRFKRYKNGEKVYDRGTIIPYEDKEYDYSRANQLGYTPDETGHMPSRDYETGRYLKRPTHPTIMKSIISDLGEGYVPTYNKKDGLIYSHRFPDDLPKYENGRMAWYDQDKDLYYGGSLPEVTVTGEKRNHSAIDYLLWKADRAGAPSHVTNAVRDFNNRILNFPVIAADATARYIKGGYDNILQAYKAADVNPSKSLKKFLVYPYTNDENNYSKAELAAMRKLSDITGKGTGAIGYKAYRQVNNGRYAGDIDFGDFNKPNKVVEWSLGQTERRTGDEPYLYDSFSYDTKDTKGVYLKGALKGNVNPVMGLRSMFGLIGSKGYDDGTNSATSIKTRIPTRYLRK